MTDPFPPDRIKALAQLANPEGADTAQKEDK